MFVWGYFNKDMGRGVVGDKGVCLYGGILIKIWGGV